MGIILGSNRYGKAENRVVRIYRDSPRHEIRDLNVSSALTGDLSAAYLTGDQATVLPTDTQKQTIYSYAKEKGIASIEDYALTLATHFVEDVEPVESARIEVEEYLWNRVVVDGAEHDHTWVRSGTEVRIASVTVEGEGDAQQIWVTGGFKELTILKSTGSEFTGFLTDEYTVLEETTDRIMATSLTVSWRFATPPADWDAAYATIKDTMIGVFATLHSLALQQTLYEMGKAALETVPELVEVRLKAPNKHHFLYDLGRFGVENPNEVFNADDRPYGLIEATVIRDDAPSAGRAWDSYSGLV